MKYMSLSIKIADTMLGISLGSVLFSKPLINIVAENLVTFSSQKTSSLTTEKVC